MVFLQADLNNAKHKADSKQHKALAQLGEAASKNDNGNDVEPGADAGCALAAACTAISISISNSTTESVPALSSNLKRKAHEAAGWLPLPVTELQAQLEWRAGQAPAPPTSATSATHKNNGIQLKRQLPAILIGATANGASSGGKAAVVNGATDAVQTAAVRKVQKQVAKARRETSVTVASLINSK